MSTRSELLDLERRFWSATGDPDLWRDRFADDGMVVLEKGLMDKATVMSDPGGHGTLGRVLD
ncbi:MAG TPA: hypothetical protein VG993_11005 [Actinomycetota bacterium]|nr:hypothetical protein [Actinomycetota bacterium]